MNTKVRWSLFFGILLTAIFPILVKIELASGLISAFYRMAIAGMLLIPYAIITKQYHIHSTKYFCLTLISGCIFGSDIAFWNLSIQSSTATQATLLTNLSPFWVGLFSLVFLRSKPTINFWLGMIISLIGLVVLIGISVFINIAFDQAFVFGILSGVFYGLYFLTSKAALRHVAVVPFMLYSTLSASIYLAIINALFQENFFDYSMQAWIVFAIQGIFCQLVAWLLIAYAMQYMKATRLSLSMLSQAIVTAILAVIFLDEVVNLQMILGGMLILFGIAVTFIEKPCIHKKISHTPPLNEKKL